MSLTIPRAGIEAGRAANAAGMQVETDPRVAAFAQLGNVLAERGAAIQRENDDMVLQRLNVDMARDMGRARQELDQLNDPNVGARWEAKSAEIRGRYVDSLPEINAPLRERAALVFDDMNNRHSLAVGQRAIDLRSSYRAAQWIEQSGTSVAEAATAPQESVDDMLAAGENAISLRLAAGDITPEQAAQERVKFRGDVLTTRARAEITANPAVFLETADRYKELGTGHSDWITTAQIELARQNEAAAKAQEVAIKEQRAAIDGALKEGIAVIKTGQQWSGEPDLANPLVQASPLYDELMAAKSLRDDKIFLGQQTDAQMQALIDAEMARPKGYAYETERLKLLQDTQTASRTAWATNGIAAAKGAGLPVPDLPAFDPNNPAPFTKGLAKRLNFDEWQRETGYAPNALVVYAPEDQAALATIMAPTADAAPKMALLQAFAQQGAPADRVNAALSAIGGDDVTRQALQLLKSTGDTALVEKMLRGQQMVNLENVTLPPNPQINLVFADATGGIFDDSPNLAARIKAAASALYAADAAKSNPDGFAATPTLSFSKDSEAQRAYAAAVQQVTGVATDRNGAPAIGGLQDVNGLKVVLPQGVHRLEVDAALENINYQLRGMQFNAVSGAWVNPVLQQASDTSDIERYQPANPGDVSFTAQDVLEGRATGDGPTAATRPLSDNFALDGNRSAAARAATKPDLDPLRAFRAASVGGSVPALGANPARVLRVLRDVQFRRVGESDVYEMLRMVDGRLEPVPIDGDAEGRAYRFRMTDLIKGAQQ